jgi:hypothetical protein
MKAVPAYNPTTVQLNDDQAVPEELVGRLYRATEGAVLDLLDQFTLSERAHLAMFCYRKSHLHGIGLAIAATCDQSTLEKTWGTALGQALFAQSRERPAQERRPVAQRSKVTLARSAEAQSPAAGAVVDGEAAGSSSSDEIVVDLS